MKQRIEKCTCCNKPYDRNKSETTIFCSDKCMFHMELLLEKKQLEMNIKNVNRQIEELLN